MTSITKINKIRTNTSDQLRTTIPKEVKDKFNLKGKEKVLWEIKNKKVSITFLGK